jgi:hypothetical protein
MALREPGAAGDVMLAQVAGVENPSEIVSHARASVMRGRLQCQPARAHERALQIPRAIHERYLHP